MARNQISDEDLAAIVARSRRSGSDRMLLGWLLSAVVSALVVGLLGDRLDSEKSFYITTGITLAGLLFTHFT